MLMLKLHYFGYMMWRAYSLETTLMLGKIEGRRRRGWQRMRQLDGVTDSMHGSLSKLREIVKGSEGWPAEVHGVAKSQIGLSNWTTWKWKRSYSKRLWVEIKSFMLKSVYYLQNNNDILTGKKSIIVSSTNWHLPSISTRIKSYAAAAADFQHLLKGIQGVEQKWGTLCSRKYRQNKLSDG